MKRFFGQFYRQPLLTMVKLWRLLKHRLISVPEGSVVRSLGRDARFEFGPDWFPLMKRMYFGLYEMRTVSVLENYLEPGDVFMDVGANIGYLTAVGLSNVGREGEVHSFEPVRKYYERLEQVRRLNPDHNLHLNQAALGETESQREIRISRSQNIGWNTIVPGFMERFADEAEIERETIDVIRLDEYCFNHDLKKIDFIKIDVEGYELPLLKGFERWLDKFDSNRHPVVLCEVAPQGYESLDYSLGELDEFLSTHGYRAFDPAAGSREVDVIDVSKTRNLLFKPGLG